jgi:hypothetical protein
MGPSLLRARFSCLLVILRHDTPTLLVLQNSAKNTSRSNK